ncbi:alfa-L-arabinofuranosidase precursor [Dentipellis sp. KUC8613]|nr:alfa-L-arabinofuranosidase precursor [Dentipellis sp. KUC8613]
MFESGDGGLYGELLQNRAFQKVTPNTAAALAAWHPINANIAVVADSMPLSSALPNALQVTVPSGASGQVGVGNEGFWGINVNASWTYEASLFFRFPDALPSTSPSLNFSLTSTTGTVFASKAVTIKPSASWTQVNVTLKPTRSAPSTANNFTVTFDGAALAGSTVNFALISLFPPTFKSQKNGMRADIAEALEELGPSFFRFPGGNNLGQTVDTRWQWNATVGPLTSRPGRSGDWGYTNTDGLGLFEYLVWIESMGMQPIMAVWSGYALGGTNLAENQLAPYIEQAKEQIEFVIGDSSTSAGALRASLGHPEPFTLNFVEVGNEDFFAAGTYPYRWRDFSGLIFLLEGFIATTDAWDPILSPVPQSYDVHVYQTPSWFAQNSFYYDGFQRNGTTYFEGEYAAISSNPNDIFGTPADGRFTFPTMASSTGEAAFMTGLERNSDIVFAASYAPLLNHVDNTQWTPNLLSFDAGAVYRSTSYYVQKLFSLNRGDEYLPSTLPSVDGTLFWSVTRRTSPAEVIIKVSNTVSSPASLQFQLPFNVRTSGTAQVLSGGQNSSNTPTTPNAVVPKTSTLRAGKTFEYTAPGFSVSVLTVPIA